MSDNQSDNAQAWGATASGRCAAEIERLIEDYKAGRKTPQWGMKEIT